MGIASWQMELVKVILEKDGPQFNRMDVLMKKKRGNLDTDVHTKGTLCKGEGRYWVMLL